MYKVKEGAAVNEYYEANKELFRDTESEAESEIKKLKGYADKFFDLFGCDYPFYLYCFCLNPLGCMKNCQMVTLNWLAICAFLTLMGIYWEHTKFLELFKLQKNVFMFFGLGCLWTSSTLARYRRKIMRMVKTMEESVTKMLLMESRVTVTLSKLGLNGYMWKECLDQLHKMNRELRMVGVVLEIRNNQIINVSDEMDTLIDNSNMSNIKTTRTAIGGLMDQQTETLDEVHECIVNLENKQRNYDYETPGYLREDLEQLNKTVVDIEKPISDFEALKRNINCIGADPADFDKFMKSQLEFFKLVERNTFQREISYCRGIFFDALKRWEGQIDKIVFKDLLSRFPRELQDVIKKANITFRKYQPLLTKGKLRNTYGPMTELSVMKFLGDLETQAHETMRNRIERMLDMYGYGDPNVGPGSVEEPRGLSSYNSSDESKFSQMPQMPPLQKNV